MQEAAEELKPKAKAIKKKEPAEVSECTPFMWNVFLVIFYVFEFICVDIFKEAKPEKIENGLVETKTEQEVIYFYAFNIFSIENQG